jgi:hypothetical protein
MRPVYDIAVIRESAAMRQPYKEDPERTCMDTAVEFCLHLAKSNIVFGNTKRKAAFYFGSQMTDPQRFDGDTYSDLAQILQAYAGDFRGDLPEGSLASHIENICLHILPCLERGRKGPKPFGVGIYRFFILTCLDGPPRPTKFSNKTILGLGSSVDLEFFVHVIEPKDSEAVMEDSPVHADFRLLQSASKRAIMGLLQDNKNFAEGWFVKSGGSAARFKRVWEITPELKIPIVTAKKVQEGDMPHLVKAKRAVEGIQPIDSGKIITKKYFFEAEDDQVEVHPADVIKGYYYGRKVVPVADVFMKEIKTKSKKELKVLHFSKAACIKRHFLLDAPFQVFVDSSREQDIMSFKAVVRGMAEEASVAICRYVWQDGFEAKLVVLIPQISSSDRVELYGFSLPTEEDVRDVTFGRLKKTSADEQSAVEKFVEENTMLGGEFDPGTKLNPMVQVWNHHLVAKVVKDHQRVIDGQLKDNIRREYWPREPKVPASLVETFKFKERQIKTVDKKDRVYWADLVKQEKARMEADDSDGQQAKKPTSDDNDDLYRQSPDSVSMARPIKDFEAMLNDRSTDKAELAIKQMAAVILALVKEGLGLEMLPKAMACLHSLRKACIAEDEWQVFNDFLKQVRQESVEQVAKMQAMWQAIAEEGISLISCMENARSDVSEHDSLAFIGEADKCLPGLDDRTMDAERKSDGLNDIE